MASKLLHRLLSGSFPEASVMAGNTPSCLLASCSDIVKTFEVDKQGLVNHRLDIALPEQDRSRSPGLGPAAWHCVRWNHNNQVLACGGESGTIALVHESGKVLEVLRETEAGADVSIPTPLPVVSLAWGGRSRFLCTSGGSSRCPSLWDLKRKARVRSFRGHRFPVHSVAFSTDDCHVASANQRGQVLIHSIRAEEAVSVLVPRDGMTAEPPASRCVRYWSMRPSYLLSGYEDGMVRAWDVTTGDTVAAFVGQHQGPVTSVVGSTVNNKLLATGGSDRRLILFDVNQRKLLKECRTTASITDMGFHPDGDMIALGCTNGDVQVFDLRRAAVPCIHVKAHHPLPVRSMALQNVRKDSSSTTKAQPSASKPSSSAPLSPARHRASDSGSTSSSVPASPASSIASSRTNATTRSLASQTSAAPTPVAPPAPSSHDGPASNSKSQSSSSRDWSTTTSGRAGVPAPAPKSSSGDSSSLGSAVPPTVGPPARPAMIASTSLTASSFRWRDAPVSEKKDEPAAATAPEAVAMVKQPAGADEQSWREALEDVREGVRRDVQALHLDMIKQFELMHQDMLVLNKRLLELTDENATLTRQLDDLRRTYS